jgi:hypothetical protein
VNWTSEGSAKEYDAYIQAWRAFRGHPSHYHRDQMLEAFYRFHVRHNGSSAGLQETLDAMTRNADRLIREARK